MASMISLMVGLPVGVRGLDSGVSDRAGAFPCQDSSCGCVNATRCWDRCCCRTDVEKMQWAVRNGVYPPAFFMARMGNLSRQFNRQSEPRASEPAARDIENVRPPQSSAFSAVAAKPRGCCALLKSEPVKVRLATFDSVDECSGFKVVLKLLTESWDERGLLTGERLAPWLLFTSLDANEQIACIKLKIDPPVPDCGFS